MVIKRKIIQRARSAKGLENHRALRLRVRRVARVPRSVLPGGSESKMGPDMGTYKNQDDFDVHCGLPLVTWVFPQTPIIWW